MDGHGSHVTLKFLEWAQQHKILVPMYPPHSTHRLQPLDVGCFAPLATYYSQLLEQQTRLSEGQTRMTKRDFFSSASIQLGIKPLQTRTSLLAGARLACSPLTLP